MPIRGLHDISVTRAIRRRWVASALVALSGCRGLDADLEAAGAAPCVDDEAFWCGVLERPLDPAANEGSTFEFAYAIRPSDLHSEGALVIVDGGPGVPGLSDMDDLTWLDERLASRFDLVYFNLRGTGEGGFYCKQAIDTWVNGPQRAASAGERDAVAAAAAALTGACVAESGWDEEDVAWLRTEAAITDLDALREAFDLGPLTLYGLSYGTQFVQEYATAYPDALRAVILDGVVDLTLRDLDYATELAETTNTVLEGAFSGCDRIDDCAEADLRAAFDTVAARLSAGAATVASPMPDGSVRTRTFDRGDLDDVVLFALDDPYGRAHLLRAILAAAQRDDFVPLRRLLDAAGGLDPYTEFYDPGDYSDAIYYAVTCNDYGVVEGGVPTWLARAESFTASRVNSAFFGDLPCATWPTAPPERARPPAFAADVPVLVINATGDVATPSPMGERVLAALRDQGADAHGVHVDGGHHVTWGDNACGDPVVNDFVLDPDIAPADVDCEGGWLAGWAPLGPRSTAGLDEQAAVDAFVAEVYALPWFPWVGDAGCDRGGAVLLDDEGGVTFRACQFFDDLVVDGTGTVDPYEGTWRFALTLSGAHTGDFVSDGTFDPVTARRRR